MPDICMDVVVSHWPIFTFSGSAPHRMTPATVAQASEVTLKVVSFKVPSPGFFAEVAPSEYRKLRRQRLAVRALFRGASSRSREANWGRRRRRPLPECRGVG